MPLQIVASPSSKKLLEAEFEFVEVPLKTSLWIWITLKSFKLCFLDLSTFFYFVGGFASVTGDSELHAWPFKQLDCLAVE